jgi:hypothetical protein
MQPKLFFLPPFNCTVLHTANRRTDGERIWTDNLERDISVRSFRRCHTSASPAASFPESTSRSLRSAVGIGILPPCRMESSAQVRLPWSIQGGPLSQISNQDRSLLPVRNFFTLGLGVLTRGCEVDNLKSSSKHYLAPSNRPAKESAVPVSDVAHPTSICAPCSHLNFYFGIFGVRIGRLNFAQTRRSGECRTFDLWCCRDTCFTWIRTKEMRR